MNGFVKIYRSFLDWEWWDDKNTFRLFVTILLLANWKDKRWHGKVIPRGSVWTSVPSLAKKSGLSLQQTKTALNKLKSTGEITDQPTREGRLITVANYDLYQSYDGELTYQSTYGATDEQPTSNRRLTTTEEYIRRDKKGKKEEYAPLDFFEGID